jgi:acyl carrier protein
LENQSISNIETNKKTNNLSPAKQSSSFALNLEENKNTKNIFEKSFLEQWVKEWISKKTGLIVEDIEMEREFSCYNIDSVAGVTMVQELEDLLGFSLSSTMIWDYPNPNKVVDYIINQLKPSKDTQTTSNKDLEKPKITNKLDSLFEQIENLSEQEAYELISKQ